MTYKIEQLRPVKVMSTRTTPQRASFFYLTTEGNVGRNKEESIGRTGLLCTCRAGI
jgi:hypothetical protein